MLQTLLYSFQLRRLQAERRNLELAQRKRVQGEKGKIRTADEIHEMAAHDLYEFDMVNDDIRLLQTRQLIEEAERFYIPLPSAEEQWLEPFTRFGKKYLHPVAYTELLAKVRAEKKERWEVFLRIVPLITALTGLLGVAIGVISILKK